jgi:hypothetical protein
MVYKAIQPIPAYSNLAYEEGLKKIGLTKLVTRRQRGDFIQMYKIIFLCF